jgi:NH3-dependent NAD+ synthetase
MVYRLAEHVNSQRPVIPRSTLEKPPSAELRPDQTDQDTLPPYEVLDTIVEDYVEGYKTPEQISESHGYDIAVVRDVVRMVERSEYKRQQAAPGLKITEKAFGVGRRFPIAQKSEV